ncbi:flagellar basal body-associated protein FliL [Nocardioides sp. MAH-18]|uniref:Flagellar protein FliL n=1 Tax=Nocardioides agri TaxID=2682843 RepID=A0A6L6XTV7_9ACTN|nr:MULTISPECIES: flagellar basal body-associated FliL family protein [unclassified Nocardioides]MBA2955770.1 flagellar basal body-associated FliL family protein [Nocardioides sp. CGMCC 1.13656]MVQ50620.1 flagellar basal body-associated protein FliL [Nocardioides sp. MAH-18]
MATKTAEKAETTESTESDESVGRLKGILKKAGIGVAVLAVIAGAAWWFVLKPAPPPEPGEILKLDAIQINLAEGHYLRLGLGLQMTSTAHELDGSKALDAAIDLFSGRELEYLQQNVRRAELKEKLMHRLEESYHGDVMEVYFTEFVTQ